MISFRIDWFGILAVQGTLKSFLQYHIWEASILWFPTFFMGQFSHLYMTTGKTVALTVQTFVGKVMSLFRNMLLKFVIAFLPRSKHLLILWLKSPSSVTLEPKKIKSVTAFHFFPIYLPWSDGLDAMIFVLWMLNFKPAFPLTSFTFIKRLFTSSSLFAIGVLSCVVVDITFSSVAQSCPNFWDPIDCRIPGFSVHHQFLEVTQIHVHWVSDAIKPSHPLSPPSPPALNLSQHQGLFQWVSASHKVAKVLEFQLQHQSFQWICRTDLL